MSQQPPSTRSKLWFIICSLCLLLLLLIAAGLCGWTRNTQSELDRYKAQLIAQGEILDMDKLAPVRTGNEPDGDEPLLTALKKTSLNLDPTNRTFSLSLSTNQLLTVFLDKDQQEITASISPPLWQQTDAQTTSHRADQFTLYQALLNPPKEKGADYRHAINYPHVAYVQRRAVAIYLHNTIISDIHAGNSDWAQTNLVTLLNLTEFQREEWTLINQMVRTAVFNRALLNIHYGLEAHAWSGPQLSEIQSRIQAVSLLTNTTTALVYYRDSFHSILSEIGKTPKAQNTLQRPTAYNILFRASLNENELKFLRYMQQQLKIFRQQVHSPHWANAPEQLRSLYEESDKDSHSRLRLYRNWLATLSCMDLSKAAYSLAKTETLRQQTLTAIALERYRLAHQQYPATLAALIPDYLDKIPIDPMDGHALRYRLEKDGTFTLWSIGFDGQDNGGDATMPDSKKQNFPQDSRDIVWPHVAPADLPQH